MTTPSPLTPWERGLSRTLLATPIFDVQSVAFRHPRRQREREFLVIDSADWVVAVAVTDQDDIVLVRQFRFGANAFSLELPGGIIDQGESPVEAAQRELAEETGYVGTRARLIGSTHPNPAIQSNRNHVVVIEQAHRARELAWDEHEELDVIVRPVPDALAAARNGRITHALMLNALFLFEADRRTSGGAGPAV